MFSAPFGEPVILGHSFVTAYIDPNISEWGQIQPASCLLRMSPNSERIVSLLLIDFLEFRITVYYFQTLIVLLFVF